MSVDKEKIFNINFLGQFYWSLVKFKMKCSNDDRMMLWNLRFWVDCSDFLGSSWWRLIEWLFTLDLMLKEHAKNWILKMDKVNWILCGNLYVFFCSFVCKFYGALELFTFKNSRTNNFANHSEFRQNHVFYWGSVINYNLFKISL
jgi:hypothetical protein